MVVAAVPASSNSFESYPQIRFQPEIQGMRALAVVAVILAHARIPGLQGGFVGVDVFFVISGFLITRLLLTEANTSGRINLIDFWTRRARRLLPAAYATLIGTVLMGLFLFPGYHPAKLAQEITFAALQIANIRFADKAVDYFQSEEPASPVLHFWSLNVEEQFYIFWPILLLAIAYFGWAKFRRNVFIFLALLLLTSFAASVHLTTTDQPIAYFGTPARCWQLATGALLAAGLETIAGLSARLRNAAAWGGLISIAAAVAILDEATLYPGYWALLPTLGAAGMLVGFSSGGTNGLLCEGLSLPVMQWIGARSYSWYLWHWPLLALPRAALPENPYIEVIAVPASLAVACAAYSYIEVPLRIHRVSTASRRLTLGVAVAGLLLTIGIAQAYRPALLWLDHELATRAAHIDKVSQQVSRIVLDGCASGLKGSEQPICLYGDVTAPRRAVLFGDSHAAHWFPAFDTAAKQTGWALHVWSKGGCPSADVKRIKNNSVFTDCHEWREVVMAKLKAERPDLVILSNRIDYDGRLYNPDTGERLWGDPSNEAWKAGLRKTVKALTDEGIAVLLIRDVPLAAKNFKSCLLTTDDCPTPRRKALELRPVDAEVASEFANRIIFADFTDKFCGPSTCPTVRDGIIVYKDNNHITMEYMTLPAPEAADLLESIGSNRPASVSPHERPEQSVPLGAPKANVSSNERQRPSRLPNP